LEPERYVAIKILNLRKLRSRDQISPLLRNSATEINNEIKILEKLNHKNIIKMIET